MQNLPHQYDVVASGRSSDAIELASDSLPPLFAAPPIEFGGPGDQWSPETLLVGAVAGCFVLTFRAVARASQVSWTSLRCDVSGTLERVDNATQFTRFDVRARLSIPAATNGLQARRALEKAERSCLISNSLKAAIHLTIDVKVDMTLREPLADLRPAG